MTETQTYEAPPPPAAEAPADPPAPERPSRLEQFRRSWSALALAAAVLVAISAGVGYAVGHHTSGGSDGGIGRFPGGPGNFGGFRHLDRDGAGGQFGSGQQQGPQGQQGQQGQPFGQGQPPAQ